MSIKKLNQFLARRKKKAAENFEALKK